MKQFAVPVTTFAVLAAIAWQRFTGRDTYPLPLEPNASASAPAVAHPRGRWRLQDPAELDRVLLWVSHILIRHDGVSREVPFSVSQWTALPPPPSRSREDAMAQAEEIYARAAHSPSAFGSLAALYSEDIVSKDSGGSLGGVMAFSFIESPEVLDALEHTPPGSVSRPVETMYGFHIFYRRPPPPASLVSGARLVIGHDDAHWLHEFVSRREVPSRSRPDALALANQLHEMARAAPETFQALVAEFSEHRDANWAGDIGAWSTREPTLFPRELEALAEVGVGEFVGPIDSLFGFEILQRTANRPRAQFSTTALHMRFDPAAPANDPSSKESVRRTSEAVAREISGDATKMMAAFDRVCCQAELSWIEGRGYSTLASALETLGIGQVALNPVEWDLAYWVVQRTAPTSVASRPALVEFPKVPGPDVGYLLSHTGTASARFSMVAVAERFCQGEAPPAPLCAQLRAMHRSWTPSANEPATFAERSDAFAALRRDVAHLLGPGWDARYVAHLDRCFEEWVLGGGLPSPDASAAGAY